MNNKEWDNIMRDRLSRVNAPLSDDLWSTLERRLEAEADFDVLESDIQLDQHVRHTLQQELTPTVSTHWPELRADLDTIDERRRGLYIFKTLELAVIFLLISTMAKLPLDFLHPSEKPSTPINTPIAANISKPKIGQRTASETATLATRSISTQPKLRLSSTQSAIVQNAESLSNITPYATASVGATEQVKGDDVIVAADDRSTTMITPTETTIITTAATDAVTTLAPSVNLDDVAVDHEQPSAASIDLEPSGSLTPVSHQRNAELIMDDASMAPPSVVIKDAPSIATKISHPESEYALSFPMQRSKIKNTGLWSIGASFGGEVNHINTPFDKIYSLASYSKEAMSNNVALTAAYRMGHVELATAIEYSRKEYQPQAIVERYSTSEDYYFQTSLNKISYDIISMPLELRYIHQTPQWNYYTGLGAKFNMIAVADYDVSSDILNSLPKPTNVVNTLDPLIDKKYFNRGVFGDNTTELALKKGESSGSLSKNYFASLGATLGLEKKIKTRTSLFIEASYYHHLLSNDIGIGPNKDRIHTTSLKVGARTILL
jgi:hypothetical protein